MYLNGPLVFHGLILESIVLGPAGQIAAVVLDAGHVPEVALRHSVVGSLQRKRNKLSEDLVSSNLALSKHILSFNFMITIYGLKLFNLITI